MVKIIFLDFDGVLAYQPLNKNGTSMIESHGGSLGETYNLNKPPVERLNGLVERTGAKIVISSTWRKFHPVHANVKHMEQAGFKYPESVIGETEDLGARNWNRIERGHEIKKWLDEHPEVESYCAIDDDGDLGDLPPARWILIENGLFTDGMQDAHVEAAIVQLNTPVK